MVASGIEVARNWIAKELLLERKKLKHICEKVDNKIGILEE